MHVKVILKDKGSAVETIQPDATIADVIDRLKSRRIGVLVVSGNGQSVDGIISERDIVNGLAEHGASLLDQRVDALMTASVRTCTGEDTVMSVMELMTDRRIRHVPVVEEGRLTGIVSIGDAVKNRLHELENEASQLREYINT
ncbi:MAG: CBS domain-containing protein [Rhodospirillaceae bacterium]|nr:CBS domain-containing protein [Rhodospirillaceae bacterium]